MVQHVVQQMVLNLPAVVKRALGVRDLCSTVTALYRPAANPVVISTPALYCMPSHNASSQKCSLSACISQRHCTKISSQPAGLQMTNSAQCHASSPVSFRSEISVVGKSGRCETHATCCSPACHCPQQNIISAQHQILPCHWS